MTATVDVRKINYMFMNKVIVAMHLQLNYMNKYVPIHTTLITVLHFVHNCAVAAGRGTFHRRARLDFGRRRIRMGHVSNHHVGDCCGQLAIQCYARHNAAERYHQTACESFQSILRRAIATAYGGADPGNGLVFFFFIYFFI